jgi:hypothetical protein
LENEARALIYLRAMGDRFAHATVLVAVQAGGCSGLRAKICAVLRNAVDWSALET